MAYSENIKNITRGLYKQKHSAEEISMLFSEMIEMKSGEGFIKLNDLAKTFSITLTYADWKQIEDKIPDPKTIRRWTKKGAKSKGYSPVHNNADYKPNSEEKSEKPLREKQVPPEDDSNLEKDVPLTKGNADEVFNYEQEPEDSTSKINDYPPETAVTEKVISGIIDTPPKKDYETEQATEVCSALPDNFDTRLLRKYGVPIQKASEIIYQWSTYHKDGKHGICFLYKSFIDDLNQREIPFTVAQSMLEISIRAKKLGSDIILKQIEIARKYRPWESQSNAKTCFKEIRENNKEIFDAIEAKEKHFDKIHDLLKTFRNQVKEIESLRNYNEINFKIESNELFPCLIEHCWDISHCFKEIETVRSENNAQSMKLKMPRLMKTLRKGIDIEIKNQLFRNTGCTKCYPLIKISNDNSSPDMG